MGIVSALLRVAGITIEPDTPSVPGQSYDSDGVLRAGSGPVINPATGLLMDDIGGVDGAGNTFGSDCYSSSDDSSMFDVGGGGLDGF